MYINLDYVAKVGGGLHGDITTIQQSQRYKRVENTGVPQLLMCLLFA